MKTIRSLSPLVLSLLLLTVWTSPAQAALLKVDFSFDDTAWSADAVFDDTTGQAWTIDPDFTAFAVTSMAVTLDGVAEWDETEIASPGTPPSSGVIEDSLGRLALFVLAIDSVTDIQLQGVVTPDEVNNVFESTRIRAVGSNPSFFAESFYTASASAVPVPATLLLFGLGLAGLGFGLRRR